MFGFHPIAVRDCVERNHVSRVHIYPDYVFSVLHAPKVGKRGHVHYVELDQFVGPNYLVTVHAPLNAAVAPAGRPERAAAAVPRLRRRRHHLRGRAALLLDRASANGDLSSHLDHDDS